MLVREEKFGNNSTEEIEENSIFEIIQDAFLDIYLIILCLLAAVSVIIGVTSNNNNLL